jgi:hypothetical protein
VQAHARRDLTLDTEVGRDLPFREQENLEHELITLL